MIRTRTAPPQNGACATGGHWWTFDEAAEHVRHPSHGGGRGNRSIHVSVRDAIAICRTCPIKDACLEWALEEREFHTILGGTTPLERHRMLRRRT